MPSRRLYPAPGVAARPFTSTRQGTPQAALLMPALPGVHLALALPQRRPTNDLTLVLPRRICSWCSFSRERAWRQPWGASARPSTSKAQGEPPTTWSPPQDLIGDFRAVLSGDLPRRDLAQGGSPWQL